MIKFINILAKCIIIFVILQELPFSLSMSVVVSQPKAMMINKQPKQVFKYQNHNHNHLRANAYIKPSGSHPSSIITTKSFSTGGFGGRLPPSEKDSLKAKSVVENVSSKSGKNKLKDDRSFWDFLGKEKDKLGKEKDTLDYQNNINSWMNNEEELFIREDFGTTRIKVIKDEGRIEREENRLILDVDHDNSISDTEYNNDNDNGNAQDVLKDDETMVQKIAGIAILSLLVLSTSSFIIFDSSVIRQTQQNLPEINRAGKIVKNENKIALLKGAILEENIPRRRSKAKEDDNLDEYNHANSDEDIIFMRIARRISYRLYYFMTDIILEGNGRESSADISDEPTIDFIDGLKVIVYRTSLLACSAFYSLGVLTYMADMQSLFYLHEFCIIGWSISQIIALTVIRIDLKSIKAFLLASNIIGLFSSIIAVQLTSSYYGSSLGQLLVSHSPAFISIFGLQLVPTIFIIAKENILSLFLLFPIIGMGIGHYFSILPYQSELITCIGTLFLYPYFAISKFRSPIHHDIYDESIDYDEIDSEKSLEYIGS